MKRLTIIDKYIIRKFIGTYFFALLLIIGIVIIFDISEKIDNFVDKSVPLKIIVLNYYANFIPYFINMFSPLFVFITVIFFTSKLAANSEITAILAGGISFRRLMYPYFLSATFIAVFSLVLNLFIIPPANKTRLKFEELYIKERSYNNTTNIHYQLSPGVFVFMESYSPINKQGVRFTLETIEGHELKSKLSAETVQWDSTKNKWVMFNYYIRNIDGDKEQIIRGVTKDTSIALTAEELGQRENTVESLNYSELNKTIRTQKMRGDKMVKYARIEKQTRFAIPFSAFILTIMGVSLSSKRRRGGIGMNIGIGIALSFSYILFMRFSQMFVHADVLPPWIALWVPNVLYAGIAYMLYRLAPK
jgi:lipopolysaccharide export system permease protein